MFIEASLHRGTAVRVSTGINRIGQHVVDRAERGRSPGDPAVLQVLMGERQLLGYEIGGNLARRTQLGELAEDQRNRLPDRLVGCDRNPAVMVVHKTNR